MKVYSEWKVNYPHNYSYYLSNNSSDNHSMVSDDDSSETVIINLQILLLCV